MNTSRKLKIHRKFQRRTWKHAIVPEINLAGKWLEKLGFEAGREVLIQPEKNKLIITLKE